MVRIYSDSPNARQLVSRWQERFDVSGAVYEADSSSLLVTADTSVEALEYLMRSLEGAQVDVEIIWRDGDVLMA